MATNILSTNEILAYIKNFITTQNPSIDVQPGTDLYDLVVWGNAQTAARIFESLSDVEKLQSLFTTLGTDLDLVAKNYNIVRKKATTATGVITFYTTSFTADITVPEGTIVSTPTIGGITLAYQTIGDYSLFYNNKATYFNATTGRYELDVPIKATIAGTVSNVGARLISIVQMAISQIQGCINYISISNGADVESDTDLQQRCALSWSSSSVGTKSGYSKLLIDREEVIDAYTVTQYDIDSVRQGIDVYVKTTSTPTVATQELVYNEDSYTVLSNQPVIDILNIVATTNWYMKKGVSYNLSKDFNGTITNSSKISPNNCRVDWIAPWIGTVTSSTSNNSFEYESATITTDTDAYVNARITFTSSSYSNYNITRTVTGFSYNSGSATFTFSAAFPETIQAGALFTIDNRPNLGDTVQIQYRYNPDILTLQTYVEQPDKNVIGSDILVKSGFRGLLTISIVVKLFSGYDFAATKTKIENALTQYLLTLSLGSDIQLSDIIVVAQTGVGTDYTIVEVDYVTVDKENTKLVRWNGDEDNFTSSEIIELTGREYAELSSINIT